MAIPYPVSCRAKTTSTPAANARTSTSTSARLRAANSVANEACVPVGGRVSHDLLVVSMRLRVLRLLQLLQKFAWVLAFRDRPAANHDHRLLRLAIGIALLRDDLEQIEAVHHLQRRAASAAAGAERGIRAESQLLWDGPHQACHDPQDIRFVPGVGAVEWGRFHH